MRTHIYIYMLIYKSMHMRCMRMRTYACTYTACIHMHEQLQAPVYVSRCRKRGIPPCRELDTLIHS